MATYGNTRRLDRSLKAFFLLAGVCLIFAPLLAVHYFSQQYPNLASQRGAEAAIGVAVILRTTLRRLLRAGSTNLLRTSIGAFSRTSARTMTRRVARTTSRIVLGMLFRRGPETAQAAQRSGNADVPADQLLSESPGSARLLNGLSVLAGFAALAISFYYVASQATVARVGGAEALPADGSLTITELSLDAAFPLLLYAAAAGAFSKLFGATTRIRTAIDGLILQGYFAGAGSFLPMTTDIEYVADERTQSRVAFSVLLTLFVAHLLLRAAGAAVDSETLRMLAAFVLVYCFVYSFPIPPLEGYWIWKVSRWLWAALWLPILVAFVVDMPDSILNIL